MFDSSSRGSLALRPSAIVAFVGLMMWSTSVACLWSNESYYVFNAGRSRFPRPVPGEGLIELTTTDGIRLDSLVLTHEAASRYWIRSARPAAAPSTVAPYAVT